MAVPSRYYTEPPYKVSKTIAFDGAAGNGAVGIVTVFTITGRVRIHAVAAFCTESLVGATATIEFGASSDIDGLIAQVTATTIVTNDWWIDAASVPGLVTLQETGTAGYTTAAVRKVSSQDLILTIGTAAVTDGTLVIDVWYEPITSDGALA